MKFNQVIALFIFLFAFSFAGFGQVEDEEVLMFSGTRSISGQNKLDFGTFKASKTLEIELKNSAKTDMEIGQIIVPEGVCVVVLNQVIKPGTSGKIAVIIDSKYIKSGKFSKSLTLSTNTLDEKGTTLTKTASILLIGELL